ncbi:MAG TPA: hypothetical protein VFW11_19070 [Cyclobacteriaceae bacterium]|nr:hypothetical protein [Cyclobacteriaceae bacterium]
MKTKITEFCLVMSCFLLMFLIDFIQSREQQDLFASASALRLKEKLNLEDSQTTAIKMANLKFYETLSGIHRSDFANEDSYVKAIQKVKSFHREKILQTLTYQQQQQWQSVLREECPDSP